MDEGNQDEGLKINSININGELNQNILTNNDRISNREETLPNFGL